MASPSEDVRIDWGVDLWDKNDMLIKHMKKGVDYCGQLKDYFSELAAVEIEYSQKLKRLHDKSFSSKKLSDSNSDDDIKFTYLEAFRDVSNEVSVIANQHAEIGEKLNVDVVKDLKSYMKELKAESQRLFQEAEKHRKEIEFHRNQLDKAQERYSHAHRDTVKATELFRKTDQDNRSSKMDVEKCRAMMNTRQAEEDRCKQEYAEQQQSFNRRQRDHYQVSMPNVHRGVQQLEEKRILRVQETLRKVHSCHQNVTGIIQKCIANMATHTLAINPSNDLLATVRKYESGEKPPGDVGFKDLSPSANRHSEFTPVTPQSNNGESVSPSATLSYPTRPARGHRSGSIKGQLEDFSDLPPAQQVRRLKAKVDELEKDVEKQHKTCEGLAKMLETFKTNEKGGDIGQTQKLQEDHLRALRKAEEDLEKFRVYLSEAQNRLASVSGPSSGDTASLVSTPRTSHTISVVNPQFQTPPTQTADFEEEFEFDEFEDEPPSPVVVDSVASAMYEKCHMLYDYSGDQLGTLHAVKGEILEVIERDPTGEQWTRVRRIQSDEIGFVPTQYISIESAM